MRILLFLFLLTVQAYAAPDKIVNPDIKIKEEAGGKQYFEDTKGRRFEIQKIKLTSDYEHLKPVIDETKLLDDDEKELVEKTLKENGRRLIMKELKPAKNDYHHDFDRGTVYYTPLNRNYSFHKVIIPDGTIAKESNFTQKIPHTNAIQGKNLTFIDCNMVNITIDASWILQGCNNAQIKRVKKTEKILADGNKEVTISHQVEENGIWKEVSEDVEMAGDMDSYNLLVLWLNE